MWLASPTNRPTTGCRCQSRLRAKQAPRCILHTFHSPPSHTRTRTRICILTISTSFSVCPSVTHTTIFYSFSHLVVHTAGPDHRLSTSLTCIQRQQHSLHQPRLFHPRRQHHLHHHLHHSTARQHQAVSTARLIIAPIISVSALTAFRHPISRFAARSAHLNPARAFASRHSHLARHPLRRPSLRNSCGVVFDRSSECRTQLA